MKNEFIESVQRKMLSFLTNEQQNYLKKALEEAFCEFDLEKEIKFEDSKEKRIVLTDLFLDAKRIEGCSDKSLIYYKRTIAHLLKVTGKKPEQITTEDIRIYLMNYQNERKSSRVTIDNIRRILSSFFSWLEDEDYIIKSPVRRIHKVKTGKAVKETYNDEELERMRDSCGSVRNLAIIDMLSSTGMRIGGMTKLKKADVIFFRKGMFGNRKGKQRKNCIL